MMGPTCQAQRQGSKAVEVKLMHRSHFGLPLILTGVRLLEHLQGFLPPLGRKRSRRTGAWMGAGWEEGEEMRLCKVVWNEVPEDRPVNRV